MAHPLHLAIGNLVSSVIGSNLKVVLDPACGGKQNIPLFVAQEKSNGTEYCNVDALIICEGKIKVIVEIEEANIKPTQICGKYLTSALSSCYIHESEMNQPVLMGDDVLFVQVLDTAKLKQEATSKISQWENLSKSIEEIIPVLNSKVKKYRLFYGNAEEFQSNTSKSDELCAEIKNFIQEK